ncbi:MAG: N,N-dimethylformamidase beta subunit family domain-containing protein, partial [Planctomycetaceae bacterium]
VVAGLRSDVMAGGEGGQQFDQGLPRRDFLRASGGWVLGGPLAAGAVSAGGGVAAAGRGVTAAENAREGTADWRLTKTGVDSASKYRCPWIEGFASRTSVRAGESIQFFVSTNPASAFRIEIFRMGYYGGLGARLMQQLGPYQGVVQPEAETGPRRLRECRWEPCVELVIPDDWVSGVYVGRLTAEREGWQSYLIFIVRDDRPADLLFQCADTTWQAYNRWPDQFALYDNGHEKWYCGPDVDVSFDRPYGRYCQILDAPLTTGSGSWFLWEYPFAYWLEQQGYDVSYLSCLDTHADPAGLLRAKGFLSIGHDEYYSLEMYQHLLSARDAGVSLCFFSGDTCWGRIDPRPGWHGGAGRIFSRVDAFGPCLPGAEAWSGADRFPYQTPSEAALIGARNVPPVTGGADWICRLPEHWVFAGTGMVEGEGIPGLVGWEWMGMPAEIAGLEVLASGRTTHGSGRSGSDGFYTATIYPGPRGNFVFNAATCWWCDGLSEPPGYLRPKVYTEPRGVDRRVQRITANLLDRICRGGDVPWQGQKTSR